MPIPDQSSPEDTPWVFGIPQTAFGEAIAGLVLAATLEGGDPLPDWLSFDAVTGTFAGTPPPDFVGTVALTVTAIDSLLTEIATFSLTVTPVDDAPVLTDRPIYRQDFEGTDGADGWFDALDAKTGQKLWSHNNGLGHHGGVISYKVGDKQYIAVVTGWGSHVSSDYKALFGEPFASMPTNNGQLIVFSLP